MKPATENIEGAAAFENFTNLLKRVVSVPNSVIQERLKQERAASEANPKRRGPKKKVKE